MIAWHVNDLKVSHAEEKTVTRMVNWLKKTYECLFNNGTGAITVWQGKIHDYLSMMWDFLTPGKVKVTMVPFVKEIAVI